MASVSQFANANTVVTTGWTNPTNAYTDDGVYATCAPAKSTSITTDYGFPSLGIPALSTITSVTFEFQYKSSTTSSTGAVIGLQGNNNGSLMGTESTFGMVLADTIQTKQYTTGLPTVAQLNAANTVKARVRGFRSTSNTAITWSVDYVKITVVYTPGYQLVSNFGSFPETGQSTGLFHNAALAVVTGSFTETGVAVGFNITLPTAVGTFVDTGLGAGLTAQRTLTATLGSFSETGNSATLNHGYQFTSAAGIFAETGIASGLTAQRTLTATAGSFSETGNPVSLTRALLLAAVAGSFSETATATGLTAQRNLTTNVGAVSETGTATGLTTQRRLVTTAGSFSETGITAGLLKLSNLVVSSGTFVLTGEAVGLSTTSGNSILASCGNFTITGNPVILARIRGIAVTTGYFGLDYDYETYIGWDHLFSVNPGIFNRNGPCICTLRKHEIVPVPHTYPPAPITPSHTYPSVFLAVFYNL